MSKREKIMLIVLAVVIVLSGAYITYAYRGKLFGKKQVATNAVVNQNINANENVNQNTNSGKTTIVKVTDPGVTWVTPAKLADLGLFTQKDGTDCDFSGIEYFKTADLASGGSVILARASCGMGTSDFLFKKDNDGKYYYLTNHNDGSVLANMPDSYLTGYGTKTAIDGTTIFASILPPVALAVDNGVQLTRTSGTIAAVSGFFSEVSNASKIGETSYGSLYKVAGSESNQETSGAIINRSLAVKLSDSRLVYYNITIPFMLDDNVANVTIDGTKNTSAYIKSLVPACGFRGNTSVLKSSADLASRLVATGTTADGDIIYYPKNANDAIVTDAYNFYKTGREDSAISVADFFAKKPIFFWKDPFGDYVTFLNNDYAPMAECGKPVVYLYPETKTNVSVSVGASITKSEPAYDNGWNVVAYPSGMLTLNGKTYDSLYWEGKGNGTYPEIKSGFVIEQKNIKSALIDQMTELGLNSKEQSDFLEFWLPRMPKTSYIRLTWFGTREMNALAPLNISPKPDTAIRVFLDFEGLNQPINITPQKLTKIARKGFTVVEWGGLLIGNTQ